MLWEVALAGRQQVDHGKQGDHGVRQRVHDVFRGKRRYLKVSGRSCQVECHISWVEMRPSTVDLTSCDTEPIHINRRPCSRMVPCWRCGPKAC